MSEKRFIVDDESYLIDMENKVIFGYNVTSYLLDLLNNLNDDVKHLEEYSGDLEADLKRFEEENEQLRHRIEFLQNYNNHLLRKPKLTDVLPRAAEIIMLNNELMEENKRLQQEKNYWASKYKEGTVTFESNLAEENKRLQQEKEYYREYAIKYLTEYELHSDKFLNILKDIMCEEDFKKIKEEENKIIEALKKEGLYE